MLGHQSLRISSHQCLPHPISPQKEQCCYYGNGHERKSWIQWMSILADRPGGIINTLENRSLPRFLFFFKAGLQEEIIGLKINYSLIAFAVRSVFPLAIMGSIFGGKQQEKDFWSEECSHLTAAWHFLVPLPQQSVAYLRVVQPTQKWRSGTLPVK